MSDYELFDLMNEGKTKLKEGITFGPPTYGEILREMGLEEQKMELNRVKRVSIDCADGSTYEGKIERIEGNPYQMASLLVTVAISGKPNGSYGIEKVIFDNPATIVYWTDGTKTVVRCMENTEVRIVDGKKKLKILPSDAYNKETGLAMCFAKKAMGNTGDFNEVFKKFIPEYGKPEVDVYIDKNGKITHIDHEGVKINLTAKEAQAVRKRFKK